MSQLPPAEQFDSLKAAKHNLDEVYQTVTRHMQEVYPLPKKFIEQTAPVVDKYLKDFSNPGAGNNNYFVFQAIMAFMQQFDDFALMTNQIFTDFRVNSDNYKNYLERLRQLTEQNVTDMSNEPANNLDQLAPELMELSNRLKEVKDRSDEMVRKLEKMEDRWNKIRTRMKQ